MFEYGESGSVRCLYLPGNILTLQLMKFWHVYAVLVVAIVTACNDSSRNLEVKPFNFTDEVQRQQNLIFRFNRPVAPDSILNRWDSVPLIRFNPEVKGMYRWTSPDELIFSPLQAFKPSTNYQAEFTDRVFIYSPGAWRAANPVFSFHTPYLQATSLTSFWIRSVTGLPAVRMQIQFTDAIEVKAERGLLAVTVGDQQNVQVSEIEVEDNRISFVLDTKINGAEKPVPVTVTLLKGIRAAGSNYVLPVPITLNDMLSVSGYLEIVNVESGFINGEPLITVTSSQAINSESLLSAITLNPQVKYRAVATDGGFVITGDFNIHEVYTLGISKTLTGILGKGLPADYTAAISFSQPEPYLSFVTGKGQFLSLHDGKQAGLRTLNIDKIHVTVHKVFANNILAFLSRNRYDSWGDEQNDYEYSDYKISSLAGLVYERTLAIKDLPKQGGLSLLKILPDNQKRFKGIYFVKVSSADQRWVEDSKLISVSDLGIIARNSPEQAVVFVNSLSTTAPVRNAEVSFISTNNQVLATTKTNGDGVAVFQQSSSGVDPFQVGMITVSSSNDFNYLVFSDHRIETSRFDVGGKRISKAGVDAYLYFEREIYRPGEKVRGNVIVRNSQMMPAAGEPVRLMISTPLLQPMADIRKNLTAQGAADFSFDVPVNALTGSYKVEVFTGNNILLGSRMISIEEFMPDRINVKMAEMKPSYQLNEEIKIEAEAVNLFGPPAAERNYELELTFKRKNFSSIDFPDYTFEIRNPDNPSLKEQVIQGKTGSEGQLSYSFKPDSSWTNNGWIQGTALLTVFDENGRPVNRIKQFNVVTQQTFLGLKLPASYFDTRIPMQIAIAAADSKGKSMAAGNIVLELIKLNWHTVIERAYDGSFRYVSKKEERTLSIKTMNITGRGEVVSFTPDESGEYRVRVRQKGSKNYVETSFYAYGWGSTSQAAFEVNNEGSIDIELDREVYKPGDRVKALFKTPFAGRLLVTVEREKMFEYYYLNTDKKSAELILPVKAGYIPNIYLTATLFKPVNDKGVLLTIAHGFKPVMVESERNKLQLKIEAPANSYSKTTQTIKLKTLPGRKTELTVAVVDEGIMQIKNTPSPDAYHYFYEKRALETSPADIYPFLMPEYAVRKSSSGGDVYEMSRRVNPLGNKRAHLVSFWSGLLTTNANGEASYTIHIPQFSGDLRVMANAYSNHSFGSAEQHIRVADPVVISTSLPRFLSPGDTLIMPVTFTNSTSGMLTVNPEIRITGNVAVFKSEAIPVNLAAHQEVQQTYQLAVGPQTGIASVEILARTAGKTFSDKTEITIRPPASLQKKTGFGVIDEGRSAVINMQNSFIPASLSERLTVDRSPMVQFTDHLEFLLDYPYGCAEQVVSVAFPQLYYADLVKQIKNKPGGVIRITDHVRAAISRLQVMQLYNGGLSYWPGDDQVSRWSTIYAAHFLIEARKAGYDVPQNLMEGVLGYMQSFLKAYPTAKYSFYENGTSSGIVTRAFASRDNFYALYVLALAGRPDLQAMNYYKSRKSEMTTDSQYLLATTYLAIGDRNSYRSVLPAAFSQEAVRETGGSFSSSVRDEALVLNALLTNDSGNLQIPVMVRHLSQALRNEKWLSTQERAFAFIALGKFMSSQPQGGFKAVLKGENGTITLNNEGRTITNYFKGSRVELSMTGKGHLYYWWEAEGITADGSFQQEDSYLKVRRTFYDRFGRVINTNVFNQGDLVVVKLSLVNSQRLLVENIAIADMLPAGFEIENPRITSVPGMDWIKDNSSADYLDVRDDRIHFFTSVHDKPLSFYYLVRAVSPGKFRMGPVMADAMYDGSYHSYHGSGEVIINKK